MSIELGPQKYTPNDGLIKHYVCIHVHVSIHTGEVCVFVCVMYMHRLEVNFGCLLQLHSTLLIHLFIEKESLSEAGVCQLVCTDWLVGPGILLSLFASLVQGLQMCHHDCLFKWMRGGLNYGLHPYQAITLRNNHSSHWIRVLALVGKPYTWMWCFLLSQAYVKEDYLWSCWAVAPSHGSQSALCPLMETTDAPWQTL